MAEARSDLHRLAELYGIEVEYKDFSGNRREASPEALARVLQVLGSPLQGPGDAPTALRERRQSSCRPCLEPVSVVWDGGAGEVVLRLPARSVGRPLACRLD